MEVKVRRSSMNFALIFVINLLVSIGFHILNPTLPKYILSIGIATGSAGLISTAFVVSSLIIRPMAGRWNNRRNLLKRLLMIGLFCLLAATVGYVFSGNIAMLVLCRLIHGLGWGISTTTAATIAAMSVPENRLGSGIGIFGLASCISNAVAPNLGLWLCSGGQYTRLFVAGALIPAVCIALAVFIVIPREEEKPRAAGRISVTDFFSARCLVPMLMILLLSVSVASVSHFLALYAEDLQIAGIGLFFTVYAVSLFVSKPMSGRASDRFGFAAVVCVCAVLMMIAFGLISAAQNLWMFIVAAVFYGVGYGGIQPALQAWCFRRETKERKGVASSTFFIGLDAGTGIGATAAGFVAQYLSYRQL